MPSSEVKHRKGKTSVSHDGETNGTSKPSSREEGKKDGAGLSEQNSLTAGKSGLCSSLDLRTTVSFLSLSACCLLAGVVLHQNARFNEVEEKYRQLYEKAANLLVLEEKMGAVSKKCDDVQVLLESQEVKSPLSHLSRLEQEVSQLREWSSGLTERRQQMQEKLAILLQAVEQIGNRTAAISSDMTSKVASVRTDVRRMGGLEGEVDTLLTQTGQLEEKVAQVEKHMVKRVGEVLAASIDRISSLKSSSEKNSQNLEQIRKRIPELSATDKKLFDRILALESSRAKLVRTVTFASDLRPKVLTIKRDFAMLEPQLADLTLRIGHLAEDVMKREEDIAQIKESLANLMTVRGDLKQAEEELAVKSASSDTLPQNDLSKTLNETD
ncbi:inhibitor of nuclear factor kappa-B kinase-interacting protein isoform X2 [Colossoma macropomum]|uniref:inhibitor of nuclear factor kappa-B kinase-interacting protein isoform X2 n=1 Tax=Colossoma macropomum TaxID=42526 RepID=UPI0018652484|nr:inhibitor of nuclear factor kappa-B kinase-interacting protein isoform X2 [Colossoma macropomum]